jgi:hypothetical protein
LLCSLMVCSATSVSTVFAHVENCAHIGRVGGAGRTIPLFVGAVVRGFPTRKSGAGADAGRPGHRMSPPGITRDNATLQSSRQAARWITYVPWDVSPCWATARLLPQTRNDDGNRVAQPHRPLARRLAADGPQQAVDSTGAI